MAKEARGTVVSVRLSDDEQSHLRAIASGEGKSVSEVIRDLVAANLGPDLPTGQTVTAVTPHSFSSTTDGVFWQGGPNATMEGLTLTVDLSSDQDEDQLLHH